MNYIFPIKDSFDDIRDITIKDFCERKLQDVGAYVFCFNVRRIPLIIPIVCELVFIRYFIALFVLQRFLSTHSYASILSHPKWFIPVKHERPIIPCGSILCHVIHGFFNCYPTSGRFQLFFTGWLACIWTLDSLIIFITICLISLFKYILG